MPQTVPQTMPQIQILNPDSLGKPLGQYSHMTRVKAAEFLFIAGQVRGPGGSRTYGPAAWSVCGSVRAQHVGQRGPHGQY